MALIIIGVGVGMLFSGEPLIGVLLIGAGLLI